MKCLSTYEHCIVRSQIPLSTSLDSLGLRSPPSVITGCKIYMSLKFYFVNLPNFYQAADVKIRWYRPTRNLQSGPFSVKGESCPNLALELLIIYE